MYVLDDLKAFRAFERSWVDCGVVLEVKKFAEGLLEWNCRIGDGDLKTCLEAAPSELVSRNGCRIEKAIVRMYYDGWMLVVDEC
jgi:hypothetical protein